MLNDVKPRLSNVKVNFDNVKLNDFFIHHYAE